MEVAKGAKRRIFLKALDLIALIFKNPKSEQGRAWGEKAWMEVARGAKSNAAVAPIESPSIITRG